MNNNKTPVQKIIDRFTKGIEIHDKMIKNPKLSPVEKNRHSYLKSNCEAVVQIAEGLLSEEKEMVVAACADSIVSTWVNRTGREHESFTQKEMDNVEKASVAYYETKYPSAGE